MPPQVNPIQVRYRTALRPDAGATQISRNSFRPP